jgi:SAM-dependent methyltransferase
LPDPHERDSLHRFSNRVADYVRYRPAYPPELVDWLRESIDLKPHWIVADIGSGTGMLSRLFMSHGNLVYGVEPNDAMRAAADVAFEREPHFVSVPGSAEATTLNDGSIDLITAGQSFHWFDRDAIRREWRRILSPGGRALIVFNSRVIEATPFMRAYDDFLVANAVDYPGVDHRRVLGDSLASFFEGMQPWHVLASKWSTREAVLGLSRSSSYVPAPGHPKHDAFFDGLGALFDQHAVDGKVEFVYKTEAYVGWVA